MKFFIRDDKGNETEIESLNLNIKKKDTIIFKVPRKISVDAKLRIKENLQQIFPKNKIIIMNADIEIGVIRDE